MVVREPSGHALTLQRDSGSVALSMREHERNRRPRSEPEPVEAQRPQPLHNVLALQRSAGNQAVAAMLNRQPVAEETTGGPGKHEEVGTVTLTKIGIIPILSMSMGSPSGRAHEATDYSFMSAVGEHSARLMDALLNGTIVTAEVDVRGFKLKLTQALVTHYSAGNAQGEPIEHWALTPRSARTDDGSGGAGGGGGGGGGSWNLDDRSRG
jgi:hypothetical protein